MSTTEERGLTTPTAERYLEAQASPPFAELRAKFRGWAFPVTVAFLSWYLLYVVMSAWATDFMGHILVANFNVAFVFGLLQFVSTFVFTWLYQRHMNRNVDPLADAMQRDLEGVDA